MSNVGRCISAKHDSKSRSSPFRLLEFPCALNAIIEGSLSSYLFAHIDNLTVFYQKKIITQEILN